MSSVFHCLLKKKKNQQKPNAQKEACFSVTDFRRTGIVTHDLQIPWVELGICALENHIEIYFPHRRSLNYAVSSLERHVFPPESLAVPSPPLRHGQGASCWPRPVLGEGSSVSFSPGTSAVCRTPAARAAWWGLSTVSRRDGLSYRCLSAHPNRAAVPTLELEEGHDVFFSPSYPLRFENRKAVQS